MADMKHLLMILIRIHVHFHISWMFLDLTESRNIKLETMRNQKFIVNESNNKQSLKAIAGRSKIAYLKGEIKQTISVMTLYSYIDNENVLFINYSHLKWKRKHKYRTRNYCKRQNGVSISERPEYINQNKEFAHWEMDLVIGNKKSNVKSLTLYEGKSKLGIAIKIHGNEATAIYKNFKIFTKC